MMQAASCSVFAQRCTRLLLVVLLAAATIQCIAQPPASPVATPSPAAAAATPAAPATPPAATAPSPSAAAAAAASSAPTSNPVPEPGQPLPIILPSNVHLSPRVVSHLAEEDEVVGDFQVAGSKPSAVGTLKAPPVISVVEQVRRFHDKEAGEKVVLDEETQPAPAPEMQGDRLVEHTHVHDLPAPLERKVPVNRESKFVRAGAKPPSQAAVPDPEAAKRKVMAKTNEEFKEIRLKAEAERKQAEEANRKIYDTHMEKYNERLKLEAEEKKRSDIIGLARMEEERIAKLKEDHPHLFSDEDDEELMARAPARARSKPKDKHYGHNHLTDPRTTIIQHGGHTHTLEDAEDHGGLIFGTMLFTMCGAQLLLVLWRKYATYSFDMATLLALWIFPIGYSVWHGIVEYFRMIALWLAFSIVCGFVIKQAISKPIKRTTPRLVYSFFHWVYRLSYGTAVTGYGIMLAHFFGLGVAFPSLIPSPPWALLLGFYGLYFGVLGRDLANVCSQQMAVSLGYVAKKGEMPAKAVPTNICAICDSELMKSIRLTDSKGKAEEDEKVHVLSCGHQFHDFCLRGWTMIGKRDTCASCNEKVTLKETSKQPWEKTSIAWAWLLDLLRYLIVYNPLVLLLAQAVLYVVY